MKTEKEIVTQYVENRLIRPVGVIAILFLLILISSFFIWIWDDWQTAWKFGLTGILGYLLSVFIYKFLKRIIKETVEKELKDSNENSN